MHLPLLPLPQHGPPSHHPQRPPNCSVAKGKLAEEWTPPGLPGWLQTKDMYSRHRSSHVQAGNMYVFFKDVHRYIKFNSQIQVTKCAPQMLQMEKKTAVLSGFLVSWLYKKPDLINHKGKVEKWKSRISIPMPKLSVRDWNQPQLDCTDEPFQTVGVRDLHCPSAMAIISDTWLPRGCNCPIPASS